MTSDEQKRMAVERLESYFDSDFLPGLDRVHVETDLRQATALEYIAHQSGMIRKELQLIRDALQDIARKS